MGASKQLWTGVPCYSLRCTIHSHTGQLVPYELCMTGDSIYYYRHWPRKQKATIKLSTGRGEGVFLAQNILHWPHKIYSVGHGKSASIRSVL